MNWIDLTQVTGGRLWWMR